MENSPSLVSQMPMRTSLKAYYFIFFQMFISSSKRHRRRGEKHSLLRWLLLNSCMLNLSFQSILPLFKFTFCSLLLCAYKKVKVTNATDQWAFAKSSLERPTWIQTGTAGLKHFRSKWNQMRIYNPSWGLDSIKLNSLGVKVAGAAK